MGPRSDRAELCASIPQRSGLDSSVVETAVPEPAAEWLGELWTRPQWYAVWTRARHEKVVSSQLASKGLEVFLPTYATLRQWKNGRHRVELPLFSGYTFVRIPLRQRLEVLRVAGVVALVGAAGRPVPLAEEEIESLRRALLAGVRAEPHPYLTVGRRVRITAGPLAGREGILVCWRGRHRVVLSIDLIQRSIRVELDPLILEPAGELGSSRLSFGLP
jgi:transcription antitermination factor NusG